MGIDSSDLRMWRPAPAPRDRDPRSADAMAGEELDDGSARVPAEARTGD